MNILITGGTGFIGSTLCSRLLEENNEIVMLSRHPEKIKLPMKAVADLSDLKDSDIFDVVINLAGEPIANKRWSDKQKHQIFSSRIGTTEKLISYFEKLENRPKLFISGSAIGYYGIDKTDNVIEEKERGDNSFSSELCQKWEAVALKAEKLGVRTCLLRTGIVLGKNGGALSKMLFPFKMCLGGRIGDGKQWMPWIHIDDLVGIILYCMSHDNLQGAINGTSPNPVTNQVFTKTLGTSLKRPTIIPMPAIVVKLLMGQMGEELLLAGKKVVPKKALDAGYIFKYRTLEEALINVV
ncbi:TIGR01777 family protein [Methylococcaceae bacterium HT4]|nr:TIGR01777 family protein [Methylococcaceae bacterium HT4]TXL18986.1 TIGR01777 family protein [Methylococcaceae bacterium HT5]